MRMGRRMCWRFLGVIEGLESLDILTKKQVHIPYSTRAQLAGMYWKHSAIIKSCFPRKETRLEAYDPIPQSPIWKDYMQLETAKSQVDTEA